MTLSISAPGDPVADRRLPVGADVLPGGRGVHFRVWAPRCRRVDVVFDDAADGPPLALAAEPGGYFGGLSATARAGTRYRLRLDDDATFPDPASRYQPDGPAGSSEVVDPSRFGWTDADWRGLALEGQVFYELHVGTFTIEGTWSAATEQLPVLAALGVTAVEVMPVADFPGRFGWGYDGVCWYAPTRLYGRPDDFRRFVDRAHALGIGVVLDVVYNHYSPRECHLQAFSDAYVSTKHATAWGATPNFDDADCGPVREFVLANAGYWIAEYHLDGLRLDATHEIRDDSRPHLLQALGERVRAAAAGRATLVVAEDESQCADLVRPTARGGFALDMTWANDWHHSAVVAATGQDEAYYVDYRGAPQEFVSAAKHGYLYQGQWEPWLARRLGTQAFDLDPLRFVHFLENHDQVASSPHGGRLHQYTSPARWRALTALLLLAPQTPMLFQGQEFACDAPFAYFSDHEPELAAQVRDGRRDFMAQFANLARPGNESLLQVPHALQTFERCKIDHARRLVGPHRQAWQLHADLLRLRREDACLRHAQRTRRATDGAVLGPDAFVLRFFGEEGDDRLLVVNLGRTLHLDPVPEPLLAPFADAPWRVIWSSQEPGYGGIGTLEPEAVHSDRSVPGRDLPRPAENWRLQGETTVLLAPCRSADRPA